VIASAPKNNMATAWEGFPPLFTKRIALDRTPKRNAAATSTDTDA
jgi:hypothetical protein